MTTQQLYERVALRLKLAADAMWDANLAAAEAGDAALAAACQSTAQELWQRSDEAWDLAAAQQARSDSLWGGAC